MSSDWMAVEYASGYVLAKRNPLDSRNAVVLTKVEACAALEALTHATPGPVELASLEVLLETLAKRCPVHVIAFEQFIDGRPEETRIRVQAGIPIWRTLGVAEYAREFILRRSMETSSPFQPGIPP